MEVDQKGANLCPKCTKIRLAAGLRPDPLRELKRSLPRPPSHNRGGPTVLSVTLELVHHYIDS